MTSEEFGDFLERATFLTNSQGRVNFSREGHLAGGSGRLLPGDLEADIYGGPRAVYAAWVTPLRG